MAWWQNKLLRYGLRYGLQKTGFLDDKAIDLENLDITIGKNNIVELKDVGLSIPKITKLAQLPSCLRIETARILVLRLTIPADFYQSSIVAEVDGVDLVARVEEEDVVPQQSSRQPRSTSPATIRTPQHRKTNRRLQSPPPYDPGGRSDAGDDIHIPTTEEVAQSFLREEPIQERRHLEASVTANNHALEESFASESSEGDIGTGVGIGLPGFLSSFLQGLVDRFRIDIRNVQIKLETDLLRDNPQAAPVTLRMKVGSAELDRLEDTSEDVTPHALNKRTVTIRDISVDLLSNDTVLAELSDLPSQASTTSNKSRHQSSKASEAGSIDSECRRRPTTATNKSFSPVRAPSIDQVMQPTLPRSSPVPSPSPSPPPSHQSPPVMGASHATVDADRFADAWSDNDDLPLTKSADLEIHPGDDNISWGSRRSQASAPAEDLWKSMVSDDLPNSLVFQPERVSTPRARSSCGSSPFTTRERRPMSPYERDIQTPGSWPRLDQSPERRRLARSSGSWPMSYQSHHSALEPLAQVLTAVPEDSTDNMRNALQFHDDPKPDLDTITDSQDVIGDDLMESKVFSHHEAESMYMSAMTGGPDMVIPGGWRSDVDSDRFSASEATGQPATDGDSRPSEPLYQSSAELPSGNITPRPQSPELPGKQTVPPLTPEPSQFAREILFVDLLSISIPVPVSEPSDEYVQMETTQRHGGMPGTFSAYSEMSRSRRQGAASNYTEANAMSWTPDERSGTVNTLPIELMIDSMTGQLDIAAGRLLYALAAKISLSRLPEKPRPGAAVLETPPAQVGVQVGSFRLSLREQIAAGSTLKDRCPIGDEAINIASEQVDVRIGSDTSLQLGGLNISLGGKDLLTFEQSSAVNTTANISNEAPALAFSVLNRFAASGRPVTDVSLQTTPIHVTLDLVTIDETFGSFGGLSGVLELGSSILSESGAGSPVTPKPSKGVRFAGETDHAHMGPEMKLNCRIGGVTTIVRSSCCAAVLRTTTLKAVYRELGAIATVEHVQLSAPHTSEDLSDAPIVVDLASMRVEYLATPQDKDLERLLSLLTPSKDKYDSDDDILIDTLLRQRRKGSLLRTAVGNAKVRIRDWECIATLSEFGKEMSQLSAVTKYLPEDERPGLLTLVRVKEAEAEIPINERFGSLRLTLQDLHLAHVGLPALLAFSVGDLGANQVDGPELLHSLITLNGSENLPVVMARMLGDEEEPTVKIKLFNVCVEYSVPMILALTNMDEGVETEEMVNAMTQSVANLVIFEKPSLLERSPGSDLAGATTKRTTISLLVHDSAIGLTPQKLPSKVILVLSDAHLSTKAPPEDTIAAKLELRKASLLVTDRTLDDAVQPQRADRTPTEYANLTHRLTTSLQTRGYIQVASVMAAKMSFRAEESPALGSKMVEVDVKNDLLLLETCADSTQTLIATLGALVPPTPPTKVPKYLTEPAMPIEDLVNSFSGQALPVHKVTPELLYDVDEEPEEVVADIAMKGSIFEEPDDILVESTMAGSLYGPTDAIFGMEAEAENDDSVGDDYPETAESLLEEDPFEMTNADNVRMGDAALMRDLARQCQAPVHGRSVDLGIYEIEDLGFDALSNGQQVLGTRHRFNAPYSGDRARRRTTKPQDVPFRLRLRDFHIIWHLYDGYDWQSTRNGIMEAVEHVEQRAEERRARRRQSYNDREDDESVIGDFLFNSIYIGVPNGHDAQELRRAINRGIDDDVSETASIPASGISRPTTAFSVSGQPKQRQRRRLKLGRSKSHKISFELRGVSADVVLHPPGSGEVVSAADVRLKDFEIFDKVPSSTWRKFLTHMTNDPSAKEMAKPMFHIRLDNVKTLESHSASEVRLHVTVLPLRLHVDQDALDFITRFFEFKDESAEIASPGGEKPFIQRVEVDTVDMCLDYKPKKIDYAGLRSGKTTEFMNFVTLEAANIRLKHAIAYGVKGFEDLHPTLNDIWMPDIKRNQLPTILAGLAPVRSLVNLGSGVRDVVAIPVREYQKDGRIVRSIQKGAFHFGKTTTAELARLGAKVALGTQTILSNAEGLLSPEESISGVGYRASSELGWHDVASDDGEFEEKRAVSAYANQPVGFLSGLRSARRYLEHDLLTARDALIAVQGEFLESRGPGDVASAIGRHAPTVILRPVIGGMRAVGTTLLGVGNQIDHEGLRRIEDKYKPR